MKLCVVRIAASVLLWCLSSKKSTAGQLGGTAASAASAAIAVAAVPAAAMLYPVAGACTGMSCNSAELHLVISINALCVQQHLQHSSRQQSGQLP
jgi:hypothetical protein